MSQQHSHPLIIGSESYSATLHLRARLASPVPESITTINTSTSTITKVVGLRPRQALPRLLDMVLRLLSLRDLARTTGTNPRQGLLRGNTEITSRLVRLPSQAPHSCLVLKKMVAEGPPPPPPSQQQSYGPSFEDAQHHQRQLYFQYSQCTGKKKALCVCLLTPDRSERSF